MTKEFLDTNVLLRFLVDDVPTQNKQAQDFFDSARDGKKKIVVLPIIIAEASFVLESFYKKDRYEIANALELFVSQRWLRVESRRELLALWQWYRQGLHFVDSFLLASVYVHSGKILTFDRQLARR